MQRAKNTLLTLFLFICITSILAQPSPDGFSPAEDFIPKSPEAATLIKFIDFPIDHYTGIPKINIPLSGISEGNISVDVSLSYHAGGHRVDEVANWVGLGWKLNAGGMITRKVRGLEDDAYIGQGFLEIRTMYTPNDVVQAASGANDAFLDGLANQCSDSEPDEFYFNFGGYQGKFAFDWTGNLPVVSCNAPVKMDSYITDPLTGRIITWRMIDPNGLRYTFSVLEETTVSQGSFSASVCNILKTYTSTWYVSKIEDLNAPSRYIEFTYDNYTLDRNWTQYETRNYNVQGNPDPDICDGYYSYDGGLSSFQSNTITIAGKQLKEITTSSGYFSIELTRSSNRPDLAGLGSATNLYRLESLIYKGASGAALYQQHFNYYGDIDRLKLASVQKEGLANGGSEFIPPYEFTYESTNLPAYNSKSIDHWGYYNGANNSTLLPEYIHQLATTFIYFPGGDRTPNESYTKASILEKIKQPTGGYSHFEYELNQYSFISDQTLESFNQYEAIEEDEIIGATSPPGANGTYTTNASNVFSVDQDSTLVEVNYYGMTCATFGGANYLPQCWIEDDMGNNVTGNWQLGVIDSNDPCPSNTQNYTAYIYLDQGDYYLYASATSYPGAPSGDEIYISVDYVNFNTLAPLTTKPTGGLRVKKTYREESTGQISDVRLYSYDMDDGTGYTSGVIYQEPVYLYEGTALIEADCDLIGCTVFACDYRQLVGSSRIILGSTSGTHIGYRKVQVLHGNTGEFGKEEYEFSSPFDHPDLINASRPFGNPVSDAFKTGLLLKKSTFKENNGSYTLLAEEEYTYEFNTIDIASPKVSYIIPPSSDTDISAFWTMMPYSERVALWNQPLRMGHPQVSVTYNTIDDVTTISTNEYDSGLQYLEKKSMLNSNVKVYITHYKYPKDLPSTFVYDSLMVRNMVGTPLEVTTEINDNGTITQTSGRKTNLSFFNTSGFPTTSASGSTHDIYPNVLLEYNMTWDETGTASGAWELEAVINSYHTLGMNRGFPISYTRTGWLPESYVWEDKLLKSKTYNAHTESYTYYPDTRQLNQHTAIDGQVVTYTYDNLMRTSSINERGGNVVSSFDYAYQNGAGMKNWIKSKVDYTTTAGSDLDSVVLIEYYDGLGRAIQKVQKQHFINGGSSTDVARTTEYDEQSRVWRQYEPYETGNNTGAYSGSYTGEPYSETSYESSPLNRILSMTPPSWYATTTTYGSNNTVITDPLGYNYGVQELFKTTIEDPNGNKVITYTDKQSRTICTQRTDNSESQSATTYITYDDKNRQTQVFPPDASMSTPGLIFTFQYDKDDNIIEKKVPDTAPTSYIYDDRELLVGTQYGVLASQNKWLISQYDDYGRVLRTGFYDGATISNPNSPTINTPITQNFYDGGGSSPNTDPIYTGKLRESKSRQVEGFSVIQDGVNDWIKTIYNYDSHGRISSTLGSNHLYMQGNSEFINYGYDWADNPTFQFRTHTKAAGATPTLINQWMTYDHEGRLTTETLEVDGVSEEIANYTYDDEDQLIQKALGKTGSSYLQEIDYVYNDQGWLLRINNPNTSSSNIALDTCIGVTNPNEFINTATDLFYQELYYDIGNSSLGATAQKNGNIAQIRWQVSGRDRQTYGFQYDYQDRLINSTYGQISSSNSLDVNHFYDTNYSYDKRGNIQTLSRNGLYFQTPDANCLSFGPIDDLSYTYYPGTNQLKTVTDAISCQDYETYTEDLNQSGVYSANVGLIGLNTIDPAQNITYQAGECVELQSGFEFDPSNSSGEFLATIAPCTSPSPVSSGSGINSVGFVQTSTGDYTYDDGGNLEYDPHKGLSIEHNWLNLPYRITNADGSKEIIITYSGDGQKLKKEVKPIGLGQTLTSQDYCNGIEYKLNEIEAVYHSCGRFLWTSGGTSSATESNVWRSEYTIADHLGNTRLTFSDIDSDGVVEPSNNELLQEAHYYPFGERMQGTWASGSDSPTSYLYNGMEFNTDLGLNLTDYGARYYDAAIARWGQVDPLAGRYATYSPYNYTVNNPIRFIDPDGQSSFDLASTGYSYEGSREDKEKKKNKNDQNTLTYSLLNGGDGDDNGGVGLTINSLKYHNTDDWQDLYKSDLIVYSRLRGLCVICTDNKMGYIFEDIFEGFMATKFAAHLMDFSKYTGPKWSFGGRNTVPDFTATNGYTEFFSRRPVFVRHGSIYEVKNKWGGLYLSSNSGQVRGHINNLAARHRFHLNATRLTINRFIWSPDLTLVTTRDTPYSPTIFAYAARRRIAYYHVTAEFKIVNGNWSFRFQRYHEN